MKNRITAIKANIVSTSHYEAKMSAKVNQFLDKVYEEISKASEKGLFKVELNFHLSGADNRSMIYSVLNKDGYTVKYDNDHLGDVYQEVVIVSWKKPLMTLNQ